MITTIDKDYYIKDIYRNMQISYELGSACAYGWIQARVNTQSASSSQRISDRELVCDIEEIIEAYREADKQWAKESEAKLKS